MSPISKKPDLRRVKYSNSKRRSTHTTGTRLASTFHTRRSITYDPEDAPSGKYFLQRTYNQLKAHHLNTRAHPPSQYTDILDLRIIGTTA